MSVHGGSNPLCAAGSATDVYMWDDRTSNFIVAEVAIASLIGPPSIKPSTGVDKTIYRMGVNAQLMPRDDAARARLRFLDGADTERYLDHV
jgi:hypothetical protein